MRKNKTFYKIFISYLLIVIVPMSILGTINYYKTLKIVQKNIENDSMGALNQAAYILDSRIKEINKLSDEFSVDARVRNFLYTKTETSKEKVVMALEVINGLMRYAILNDYVDEVYIYSKNNETIISTTSLYTPEMFYKNIFKNKEISYDNWMNSLDKINYRNFIKETYMQGRDSVNRIVYINSIPNGEQSFGDVIIHMSEEKYKDVFKDVVNKDKGYYYVLDEDNNIIISNDIDARYAGVINSNNKSGIQYIKDKSEKAMMLCKYSTSNNWRYVVFIPNRTFISQIASVKQSTILLICVVIMLAFVMSIFAATSSYKNVKKIINLIKGTLGAVTYKGDDYSFIANILKNSFSEIKENKELLNKQIPMIKQSFLSNLLKESENIDLESLNESTSLLKIDFKFYFSTVVIFRLVEDLDKLLVDEEERSKRHEYRIIINKIIEDGKFGYGVSVDNYNTAFVCGIYDNNENALKEKVDNLINSVKQIVDSKLNVVIGVGNNYLGYSRVNDSFEEAMEAADFATYNNKRNIHFNEINRKGKIFTFPIQKEVQLINYIKNSKKDQALELIRNLYEENYRNNEITYDMMRLFVYNLYCTVIRVLGELKVSLNPAISSKINILDDQKLKTMDIPYILNSSENIIITLCEYLDTQRKDSTLELKFKVTEFIDNNLLDNQLSLDFVADNFNITPQYLSKFFKESIGLNYVEYVNCKKIEMVKEYLHNNETVRESASKAGFDNMGNFIKVFKKLVGVTPSEYKKEALKDSSLLNKN
jgi:two-component system response regulator YesN